MKYARGHNKLFQDASLLNCYRVALRSDNFNFKDPGWKICYRIVKVEISPDHPTSNNIWIDFVTYIPFLRSLQCFQLNFSLQIVCHFSAKQMGIFYQIILSHTLDRGPNKSLIFFKCHQR